MQLLENNILLNLLHFFRIPALISADELYTGNSFPLVLFTQPINLQILFLAFFPALAIAADTSLVKRAKISLYGAYCFIGLVVLQFLIIITLNAINLANQQEFQIINMISVAMFASVMAELSVVNNITLPKHIKPTILIKRSFIDEYLLLGATLVGTIIIFYYIIIFLGIKQDSVLAIYLTINIQKIMNFMEYVLSLVWQIKTPSWIRWIDKHRNNADHMSLTFLLPAYNEEEYIKNCIESIDRAAKHYRGSTEIVIINDGSTDNTRKIASDAVLELKHSRGIVYNIPNSGKGLALNYGMKKVSGDVIFRIDTDSIIGEWSIVPVMNHFRDPQIGSVSGWALPIVEKTFWQKNFILTICQWILQIRGQETIDAIRTQPGGFSVFRRDALLKLGGWKIDQFGEDGEITVRLGNAGYRNTFELGALAYTDVPKNFKEQRDQRVRWGIGYYQSRTRNFGVIKEFAGPRSAWTLLNIINHGMSLASILFLPYLITKLYDLIIDKHIYSITELIKLLFGSISYEFILLIVLFFALKDLIYVYYLIKFKKLYLIHYIPTMRVYELINGLLFTSEAVDILLNWSSKFKVNNFESFDAMRKYVRKRLNS